MMLTVLRKLRISFIESGSARKYLLYAISEILLVMVGILLALYVNNWNENRKTIVLANKYISDIRTDLVNDTVNYNSAISRLERIIDYNRILLNPELTFDSLLAIIGPAFGTARIYKIDNSTYLKLSNTGFLTSGIYNTLFEDINTYYINEHGYYSEIIKWDEERTVDIFHPDFFGPYNSTINFYNDIENKRASVAFRNFINSNEFINKIWANQSRKKLIIQSLLKQKQIAIELIENINQNLQINNNQKHSK